MRILFIIIAMTMALGLYAESMQINTPDGSVSIQFTDNTKVKDGKTTSGTVIDNIAVKLDEMDKTYLVKLSKLDQVRTKKLMDEIYSLLALLPTNDPIKIEAVAQTPPPATSSSNGNMNININVSGMQESNPEPVAKPEPPKPVVQEKPQPVGKTAMAEMDFATLLNNVKKENFADNQLRVVRTASRNAWFTVNQITRMMDVFSFSEDKIECLSIMYPRVTDPQNNFKILDSLTFSEDKEKAEAIINR